MKTVWIFLIATVFISGCSTPAYLPRPDDLSEHVNGSIIQCHLFTGAIITGELIAVDSNKAIILPVIPGDIKEINKEDIGEADIIVSLSCNNPDKIATLATFMSFLPLAHGFYGIFSLPITLITTISTSVNASNGTYSIKYPIVSKWGQLRKFARFPQGIPANVDRETLEMHWYRD